MPWNDDMVTCKCGHTHNNWVGCINHIDCSCGHWYLSGASCTNPNCHTNRSTEQYTPPYTGTYTSAYSSTGGYTQEQIERDRAQREQDEKLRRIVNDPHLSIGDLMRNGKLCQKSADWGTRGDAKLYYMAVIQKQRDNAAAYMGLMCAELYIMDESDLKKRIERGAKEYVNGHKDYTDFENFLSSNNNFQMALHYAHITDIEYHKHLNSYNKYLEDCIAEERRKKNIRDADNAKKAVIRDAELAAAQAKKDKERRDISESVKNKISSFQAIISTVNTIQAKDNEVAERIQYKAAEVITQSNVWKKQGKCPYCGSKRQAIFGNCKNTSCRKSRAHIKQFGELVSHMRSIPYIYGHSEILSLMSAKMPQCSHCGKTRNYMTGNCPNPECGANSRTGAPYASKDGRDTLQEAKNIYDRFKYSTERPYEHVTSVLKILKRELDKFEDDYEHKLRKIVHKATLNEIDSQMNQIEHLVSKIEHLEVLNKTYASSGYSLFD